MIETPSSFKSISLAHTQQKDGSSQSKAQPQYYNSKLMSTPVTTIRLNPLDDYSKNKIMELQQQLLRLRKQLSQRQCTFNKQRSNLTNKIQILNLQNLQLKQRQNHLVKVNKTLELAMTTKDHSQNRVMNDATHVQQLEEEINQKNRLLKELKKTVQQYKKKVRYLEDQKEKQLEEKNKKITQLNNINKRLTIEQEDQINRVKNQLNSLPFNRQIINSIFKALNFRINSTDLTYEDLSIEQSHFMESPISSRRPAPDSRGYNSKGAKYLDNSYSRISSRSFINQLNSKQMVSQCSEDGEQSQKLLCQICKKVFTEQDFINHMEQCSQISELQKKRYQLEKAINELDQNQRKSISQRKFKTNKNCETLREWDQNQQEKSTSKIQKKQINCQRDSQQLKIKNRPQLYNNNYKSNRFN